MAEYQMNTSVHVTPTGDGALVLLETHAGKMFHLNHTGAALWTALGVHNGDLLLAAQTVSQQYGKAFHQVVIDARVLVEKLIDANLLEYIP